MTTIETNFTCEDAKQSPGERNIELGERPQSYGLMSDPSYTRCCESVTRAKLIIFNSDGCSPLAAFLSKDERVMGLRLPVLYPLGGTSESPFYPNYRDSDCWGQLAAGLKAASSWAMVRVPGLTATEAAALEDILLAEDMAVRVHHYQHWAIISVPNYAAYLSRRGTKFRHGLKVTLKEIEKAGGQFTEQVGLQDWSRLYQERHKNIGPLDYSVSSEFQRFLFLTIDEFRTQGRLVEIGLRVEGQIIAAAIGITVDDVFYAYQLAHNPKFRSLRPGAAIICRCIEAALNRGCRIVTFLSNAPYLRQYADQAIPLCEVEAFAPTSKGRALYWYRKMRESSPIH